MAAGLAARGVGRGARVGILALNRPEYIAALYGTMRAGAIPVPLNVKLPAESLAFIARDAGLSLLFVDAAHRAVAPAVPAVDFDAGYAELLKPGPFDAVAARAGRMCVSSPTPRAPPAVPRACSSPMPARPGRSRRSCARAA